VLESAEKPWLRRADWATGRVRASRVIGVMEAEWLASELRQALRAVGGLTDKQLNPE